MMKGRWKNPIKGMGWYMKQRRPLLLFPKIDRTLGPLPSKKSCGRLKYRTDFLSSHSKLSACTSMAKRHASEYFLRELPEPRARSRILCGG
jgi:hypothetical protein